jgi:urease accessory protein
MWGHPVSDPRLSAVALHPILHLDHLLLILGLGWWAALHTQRAVWIVPALFCCGFGSGVLAGLTLSGHASLETGVALCLLLLGLALGFSVITPAIVCGLVASGFGLIHGWDQGACSAPDVNPAGFLLACVAATGVLHGIGLASGLAMRHLGWTPLMRAAGYGIALVASALILRGPAR